MLCLSVFELYYRWVPLIFLWLNFTCASRIFVLRHCTTTTWKCLIGSFKQQRFWATHVNRKWPFFIFWRWFRANFQSNRLYNSKEAKWIQILYHQGMLRGKTPHFRLTCVAQKRRCLSSLISRSAEDVNTRQRLSFSFPELWYSLLDFNSRKNCQHLTNSTRWNKFKFETARIPFLSEVFVAAAVLLGSKGSYIFGYYI